MSWTYDPSLAAVRDQVRFTIGDTDVSEQQFTNEELDFLITTYGSVGQVAIVAIRGLIAKYARKVNKAVGDLKISYGDRIKQYEALLEELQTTFSATAQYGTPSAPAIFVDRRSANQADTTLRQPVIEVGMHDNEE